MMMVGLLIATYQNLGLDEDGRDFTGQLATLTPAEAIQHPWLRGG